jgi:hypothetical protein
MAQTSDVVFALERFELSGEDRLEVVGRWEGLGGRRMGRPVLTVVESGGRRRRLNALPGGQLSSTQPWRASFAWDGDVSVVERAELELGRRLVVELPPPRRRRRRSGTTSRTADTPAPKPTVHESAVNGTEVAALTERITALTSELEAARAEAADLRERLQTARDGIVERDQRLMTTEAAAAQAAEDAGARLDAERAEAAGLRTRLAEAREAAERARIEAEQAIAAEAEETERLRGELLAVRTESERAIGAERTEASKLREELASRPAAGEPTDDDAPNRRMLDRVTRDLERERVTTRTLRRELEVAQSELAELRRATAVSSGGPGTAEQPAPAVVARRGNAAHRIDIARAAGAQRVPDHHPSAVALWITRAGAAVLVALLLVALALIVVPLL